MADTCYLCAMGPSASLASGLAAAEGFGTCHVCSVHACPKHGERTVQFFRCADCMAADPAAAALTLPPPDDDPTAQLRADAPRLYAVSNELRANGDPDRMAAAINWIHREVRDGGSVGLGDEVPDDPRRALGAELPGDFKAAALSRAHLLEAIVHDLVRSSRLERCDRTNGELALAAVAIGYAARGEESLERTPLDVDGGLQLAPATAVLAHVYARPHLYW